MSITLELMVNVAINSLKYNSDTETVTSFVLCLIFHFFLFYIVFVFFVVYLRFQSPVKTIFN